MAGSEIMKKLNLQHNQKSQKDLETLARKLTNTAELKKIFDHLLQAGEEMVLGMVEQQDDDLLHTLERVAEHQRVKHDTARALHLPIQLSLQVIPGVPQSFSSWLNFEYGVFHAILTVGDVAVEWGRESIVDPQYDPIPELAEFKANVGDQGEWLQQQGICQIDMSLADRERNSEKKLDILCESMTEKARLIARLVDVIVDYNQNKRYHVFQCNCQDFVRDAMAALGIKKPVKFQGNLQKHFEQLKMGNVRIPPELQGHENLDVYVTAHLQDLERQDMEYLQCLYFKAHLPALEKARDPNEWKCDIPTCKTDELDTKIGMHALPFNQFLGTAPVQNQSPMALASGKENVKAEHSQQASYQEPQKCYNCRQFFGNEEYQGLCNTCFMEKTKVDILSVKPQISSGGNDRHQRISDKEHTIGQRALSGHGAMVQHSDIFHVIEDDRCYLCFDKQVRRKNPVCDRHAQIMIENT